MRTGTAQVLQNLTAMGRLLLPLVFLLSCSFAFAEGELYLSPLERAVIALTLKIPGRNGKDTAAYIAEIRNAYSQAKSAAIARIEVQSFQEFLRLQSDDRLFSESNLDDLGTSELFEKMQRIEYFSKSNRVQNKIKQYWEDRKAYLSRMAAFLGFASGQVFFNVAQSQSEVTAEIQKFINVRLDAYLAEMNLKQTPQVMVLTRVIKLYFENLPLSQKAEMAYQISLLPINSTPMDIFLTMIQNCGPQLQKLAQIKGRDKEVPPKFQAVFQELESKVKKVPWKQVEKLLRSEDVDPASFGYFGKNPKGVGTMAQTHWAQTGKGQDRESFVVRFLKPGIEELLEMDHQILKKVAAIVDADPSIKALGLPQFSGFVEDLHASVLEELILAKTVQQQSDGALVYNRSEIVGVNGQKLKIRYHVPKAYLFGKGKKLIWAKKWSSEKNQRPRSATTAKPIQTSTECWRKEPLLCGWIKLSSKADFFMPIFIREISSCSSPSPKFG